MPVALYKLLVRDVREKSSRLHRKPSVVQYRKGYPSEIFHRAIWVYVPIQAGSFPKYRKPFRKSNEKIPFRGNFRLGRNWLRFPMARGQSVTASILLHSPDLARDKKNPFDKLCFNCAVPVRERPGNAPGIYREFPRKNPTFRRFHGAGGMGIG